MNSLWPDTFVEEASLSYQIGALRKALGDEGEEWIETVPKHGYRFDSKVTKVTGNGGRLEESDFNATLVPTAEAESVARPNRRTWIAGTAAGVVAVGLTGAGTAAWFRRQSGRDISPLRVEIEPPRRGRILLGRGVGSSCGFSPDGRTVAYIAMVGGRAGLWIRPLADTGPRLVADIYANNPFWSPDNKSVAFGGGDKLWRVDVAGGAPWAVCEKLPGGYFRGGAWSADGYILFASEGNGLFRVSASGGTPASLTELDRSRGERGHVWPQALPGGRFLYLALSDQPENMGIYAASLARPSERVRLLTTNVSVLYAQGADGKEYLLWHRAGTLVAQEFNASALKLIGEPHLVASSIGVIANGVMGSASANGSLIYAASNGSPCLLTWFNREGKSLGRIGEGAAYETLRLSPDEKQVAVLHTQPDGQEEVWILQSSRGAAIRLAEGAASVWSPQGQAVIYGAGSPRNLFRQEIAGSGSAERLTQSPNPQFPFDWSRDGQFIIYQERVPGNRGDLMIMELRPDGEPAGVRPWLKTAFTEMEARFSPELPPRWVAYGSTESGREEVYIDSFLGPRRKVRVSTNGGRAPQWRGDGRELFFQSLDYKLMAVDVKPGVDSIETSAPHELFALPIDDHNLSCYEAAGDGQRFLVLAATEQSAPLTLVVNWPALLKNPAGQ